MIHSDESNSTKKVRRTFQELISFFPSLTISLTYADIPKLHIETESGDKFSLIINLLEKSDIQVREAIFGIKEKLKLFDS